MPVLTFQLAGKSFAVELTRVQQVVEYREPTRTPRRPPFVEGVIPHAGEFVPVVSLRKRLGYPEAGPSRPPIVLLTGIGEDPLVGVIVDQVLRVLPLPRDGVLAPPPRVFGIRAEFIRGVANAGGRPVVWLEAAKLLTSTEPVTLLA
jgi:purine-binding chemotaxis protein CheW